MSEDDGSTDPVWTRIDAELGRRREKRLLPASWADLARRFDTTEQRLNNWRRRRVPPAAYGDIADALGWTVDQVAGRDPLPKPAAAIANSADQMLSLMTVFSRLSDEQRERVIEFALDQEKQTLPGEKHATPPNLNPDDPGPTKPRTPRTDQGAVSQTPLSKSSGAQARRARK